MPSTSDYMLLPKEELKNIKMEKSTSSNGNEIANFHYNGVCIKGSCLINKDENGYKFVCVSNCLNNSNITPEIFRYSFSGRVKDLVDHILYGFEDVLYQRSFFGEHDYCIRYFDREYGEKIRQKSIEG